MPAPAQTSTTAIVKAGRRLIEERGVDALTLRDVAEAVGVRAPSLYKRIAGRSDLVRLIADDVIEELLAAQDAAIGSGDPVTDLRALLNVYREFAHANPAAFALLYVPGEPGRLQRLTVELIRLAGELVGPEDALPAARTVVSWANGFIGIELGEGFRLGGDVQEAWEFGLRRVLAALQGVQ
jgi:AcrR family transcriptional regulator